MQHRMARSRRVFPSLDLKKSLVFLLLLSHFFSGVSPANEHGIEIDAVETPGAAASPNYYCGLYSVYTSAKRLGIDIDFEQLLQPKYLSARPGSTAGDLKSALEDLGLQCDIVSNLSIESLARFSTPVIIHTRAGASQDELSHWMVYAGFEPDSGYKLYDPPFSNGTLSGTELKSLWGGTALIVYKPNDGSHMTRWLHVNVPSSKVIFLIASLFVGAFCISRLARLSPGLGMGIAILSIAACTQLSADSFVRNLPLVSRQSYYPFGEVTRVTQTELKKFPDAIYVDARSEQQHAVSRVPGSHSLPLGSGILRMKQFISANDEQTPIIVYCASAECAWAEIVAQELISLGRNDVYVMDEGMRGWRHEIADE